MKKIFVCSPFQNNPENADKARRVCKLILDGGNAPFAPHCLYPSFMDDSDPKQRELAMKAGITFMLACEEVWVVGDQITEGMREELKTLLHSGSRPILPLIRLYRWSELGIE